MVEVGLQWGWPGVESEEADFPGEETRLAVISSGGKGVYGPTLRGELNDRKDLLTNSRCLLASFLSLLAQQLFFF